MQKPTLEEVVAATTVLAKHNCAMYGHDWQIPAPVIGEKHPKTLFCQRGCGVDRLKVEEMKEGEPRPSNLPAIYYVVQRWRDGLWVDHSAQATHNEAIKIRQSVYSITPGVYRIVRRHTHVTEEEV